jgi:hypothetical protein
MPESFTKTMRKNTFWTHEAELKSPQTVDGIFFIFGSLLITMPPKAVDAAESKGLNILFFSSLIMRWVGPGAVHQSIDHQGARRRDDC